MGSLQGEERKDFLYGDFGIKDFQAEDTPFRAFLNDLNENNLGNTEINLNMEGLH